MDEADVERWFASYLADFIAPGRGDSDDIRRILAHYGVPMIFQYRRWVPDPHHRGAGLATAKQQIDGMRSAGYDRSDELGAETAILNRSCAVRRGRFARLRADGTEISQLEATYLITEGAADHRISAIIIHSPQ
jgi:hypothetical protein